MSQSGVRTPNGPPSSVIAFGFTFFGILFGLIIIILYLYVTFDKNENYDFDDSTADVVSEHLYVVLLYSHCIRTGWKRCTGSVISKKHVLTAAHCIVCNITETNATLRFVNEIKIKTQGWWGLYQFHTFARSKDIAIIELGYDEFDVSPVKLLYGKNVTDETLYMEHDLTALGLGLPEKRNKKIDVRKLYKKTLNDGDLILRNYGMHTFNLDYITILNGEALKKVWYGDSGGPLVITRSQLGTKYFQNTSTPVVYQQIGLISGKANALNAPNGTKNINGFVPISAYCDFIQDFTNSKAVCR